MNNQNNQVNPEHVINALAQKLAQSEVENAMLTAKISEMQEQQEKGDEENAETK